MTKVDPIPAGMTAVTPHLVCAGAAQAITFYENAFGAVRESLLPGPDGKVMHAMIRIGGAAIMLVDEAPQWGMLGPKALEGSPVMIHLYVKDADAVAERAVKAGATLTMPVAEQFWGDRYGCLEDPFGHRWSVATRVRELTTEQMMEGMRAMK